MGDFLPYPFTFPSHIRSPFHPINIHLSHKRSPVEPIGVHLSGGCAPMGSPRQRRPLGKAGWAGGIGLARTNAEAQPAGAGCREAAASPKAKGRPRGGYAPTPPMLHSSFL